MILHLPTGRVDLRTGVLEGPRRALLTTRERELLRFLAARPGVTVERSTLLTEVFGYAPTVVSRAVDSVLHRLREKVELEPDRPAVLVTVHGGGVRYQPTEAAEAPPRPVPDRRVLHLGTRRVDLDRAVVEPDGAALTANEVALLDALWRAGGSAVDRGVLARSVWGRASGRELPNALGRLRKKLEADPARPEFLITTAVGLRLDLLPRGPAELPPVPRPLDRTVGRGAERAALAHALRQARVVTLAGPPGVGKTRLAVEHAADEVERGRAAVIVTVEPDLDGALASALGLLPVRDPARALGERGSAPLLLVLDGAERACAEVRRWVEARLRSWQGLRVLVTARAPLRAKGEGVVELGPLAPPDGEALFHARSPRQLPPTEHGAVRELCAALDQLPLAIEVAAAQTRGFDVPSLLAALRRHGLWPDASIDALGEPRSLPGLLDAVYASLSAPARALAGQLAAFAGPFDAGLASRAAPPGCDAASALQELVAAGLVWPRAARWISPPVFARAPPSPQALLRHAAACVAAVDDGADPQALLEDLELAALRTAPLDPVLAFACAGPALDARLARGPWGRVTSFVAALADHGLPPGALPLLRARVALAEGAFDAAAALLEGDPGGDDDVAAAWAVEASRLAHLRGAPEPPGLALASSRARAPGLRVRAAVHLAGLRRGLEGLASALQDALRLGQWGSALEAYAHLAAVRRGQGRLEGLPDVLDAWEALARRVENPRALAAVRLERAALARAGGGAVDAAKAGLLEALSTFRSLSDRVGTCRCLVELAHLSERLGEAEEARVWGYRALALAEELPLPSVRMAAHARLAELHRAEGAREVMASHLHVAMVLARELGDGEALARLRRNALMARADDGDLAGAIAAARELLAEGGPPRHVAMTQLRLGELLARSGAPEAVHLLVDAALRLDALGHVHFAAAARHAAACELRPTDPARARSLADAACAVFSDTAPDRVPAIRAAFGLG